VTIHTRATGSMPRPEALRATHAASIAGQPVDPVKLKAEERTAVAEIVPFQLDDCRIRDISDGELSELWFGDVPELSGFNGPSPDFVPDGEPDDAPRLDTAAMGLKSNDGPIEYDDDRPAAARLSNFAAALEPFPAAREHAFLTTVSPETVVLSRRGRYYKTREAYLAAAAAALNKRNRRYTDAGFPIQIDAPGVLMIGHVEFKTASLSELRYHVAMGVDAINASLDGIPRRKVALHLCRGNYPGKHAKDRPRFADVADLVWKVNACLIVLEASTPAHRKDAAEAFRKHPMPDGWNLAYGVVDPHTEAEDPDDIARDLIEGAEMVGRERLRRATTRCGFGTMGQGPWNPTLDFVRRKHLALAEGTDRANDQLG
jgi:5-methyltetrahydropteroyltriglutamate--homocysteine methyltransferase